MINDRVVQVSDRLDYIKVIFKRFLKFWKMSYRKKEKMKKETKKKKMGKIRRKKI